VIEGQIVYEWQESFVLQKVSEKGFLPAAIIVARDALQRRHVIQHCQSRVAECRRKVFPPCSMAGLETILGGCSRSTVWV
jgi:hypothetical protein